MIKPASEFIAEAKAQCNCLDAATAKELFDKTEGAVILDVREPTEVAESKLSQSVNIPRGQLETNMPSAYQDAETTILIHCAVGGRASLAAARLQEMGYKNIYPILEKYSDLKAIFG